MKNKILIMIMLFTCFICLTGCNNKDAKEFKSEYESFNNKSNDYFSYRNLNIEKNNPFVYSTAEEIVSKIENNETFVVYFGDPECPWCRSVIEQAATSAIENGIEEIYYVRIWDGFHNEILRDTYQLEDGKAILKKSGTDAYYEILKYFDNILPDYTLTDEDDNVIDVNEKRIFAPNFIYVEEGKATKLIEGISDKQEGYNDELTDEIIEDEKEIFNNFFKKSNSCDNQSKC